MIKRFVIFLVCSTAGILTNAQQKKLFNNDWEFVKDIDTVFSARLLEKNSDIKWEKVSLPHTANIEPIEKKAQQWQGICFYRKFFIVPAAVKGKHIALQFEAAMQDATVYLNGQQITRHLGGYLPFYIDVSDKLITGSENSILVVLDNKDNPLIPPGKPLKSLDFNYYSGIYRNVWMITKDKLYISDAVTANKVAGGGVFAHYDEVSDKSATLIVKTEVNNDFAMAKNAQVKTVLTDKTGKIVAQALSGKEAIAGNDAKTFTQTMKIVSPKLWSPSSPYLYNLSVAVLQDGKVVDTHNSRSGIKVVRIEGNTFYLNNTKIKIRGTNRHQDYPYIGNALSDNAQYRDAWKIKQAGFNFVRSSHYPQSPAYLDACDELGIMVMDAIPGWQFAGNDSFQHNSFRDIHDMIHRDRHHASIVLWEASLNESGMKKEYMEKAHAIVHEELAFPGIYSAGWRNTVYDVFLPARQHGKAPDYWKKYDKPMALLTAEYGDWEYYAQNAGFNQTDYKDLKAEERTSRQLRGWGEKRLLQQALNYQESHNDNLYGHDLGDANWLMFDYNRGYAEDIESSGIMDMVRLPKFSFYFYQSQVDPLLAAGNTFNKPMVYIANFWQNGSTPDVKVYSNCDEVELRLNGKLIARQHPDKDANSTNLKHPPFTFAMGTFQPGTLVTTGYINNKKVAVQQITTAGEAAAIKLDVDYSGKQLKAGQNDIVFVYASVIDKNGNIVNNSSETIDFTVTGDASIAGPSSRAAEAGISTILLKAGAKPGKITVTASGKGLRNTTLILNSK